MQVINQEQFDYYKTSLGELYIKGNTNLTIEEISKSLDSEVFPFSLRGNFALIYISQNIKCYAVDHYSTIPLFYTDSHIGISHQDVKRTLNKIEDNVFIKKLIGYFGGYSVGPETNIKGLYRVEPCTYVWNGKVERYIDLFSKEKNEFNPLTVKELFKASVSKNADTNNNGLLLSGGKDSSSLLGCLLNWGYEVSPISLISEHQTYSDKKIVEQLSKDYNIDVDFVNIDYSGPILNDYENDRYFGFWRENPFGAKKDVLKKYNFSTVLTGEAGPSVYTYRPQLNYAIQKKAHIVDIIKILVIDIMTYHRVSSVDTKYIWHNWQEHVDFLIDYYYNMYNSFETNDITNKLIHLTTIDQSAYRVFAYSQDFDINWKHPYMDWNFVNYIINLDSKYKINKNILKLGLSELISHTPWRYPKNGLSIPSINKYRRS